MTRRLLLDVLGEQVELAVTGHEPAEELYRAAAVVAIERSPRLLLHSGAVSSGQRAVLFPGASGVGKSTMVAACLRQGFAYLSDEMVALDPGNGTVQGWSRPLMLTRWSTDRVGLPTGDDSAGADRHAHKLAVPAHDLGAGVDAGPVAVAHVVGLRHRDGAGLVPMTGGELLTQLLMSSFNHYRHGVVAWRAAALVARRAQGWWLDAPEPIAGAKLVAGLT